ncbi:MAG TPA: hypothetical protein VKU41_07150 [Polyangiaceae bacterium]|nr:hypothetical protein [Polyangiaceae bacterium]
MRLTRWDANVLARAATVATLALALIWLVTAATDEGGIAWTERAGRTLPLAPLCAAIGAWGSLVAVQARGEALALESLGRSPPQITAAAVAGGALVGLVAAAVLGAVAAVDITGFYPTAVHASSWRWHSGDFVDEVRGMRVTSDGTLVALAGLPAARALPGVPAHGRLAAALETALSGIALPLLVARTMMQRASSVPRRPSRFGTPRLHAGLVAGVAVTASVALFQAAAARRLSAAWAAVPPLFVLAYAARPLREPA